MKTRYNVNEAIKYSSVRVIDADGSNAGIMRRIDALHQARLVELDLVEIDASADPPVCRIMDYGKFMYEQSKKTRNNNVCKQKTIRLSPRIGENDRNVKLKQTVQFLEKGCQVTVEMLFKGRMITHKEIGQDILERFIADCLNVSKLNNQAQWNGNRLTVMLVPKKSLSMAV